MVWCGFWFWLVDWLVCVCGCDGGKLGLWILSWMLFLV